MNFSVVIPARYGSTRLPGKALADLGGKPMVQQVFERAKSSSAAQVFVATDDARIQDALTPFSTPVLMTSTDHQSGTDRLAEVVDQLDMDDEEIVVNVQGDEPLIPSEVIDQVAANLFENTDCVCATLSEPISLKDDFLNASVVKVVSDNKGRALYFSRAPIPWPRDQMIGIQKADPSASMPNEVSAQRHIGIYAYRVGLLRQFTQWEPASLERLESLEQLRILSRGMHIHVAQACAPVPGGIDTPEDLENVRRVINQ